MNRIVAEEGHDRRTALPTAKADGVVAALSKVLGEGIDVHRCLAAQALGRIGGRNAARPLIAALLDEDEDVRTDAAGALAGLADPGAAPALLESLLGDPCIDVKIAAIEALARLRHAPVVPWLRRLLRNRDEGITWDETEFLESGWDGRIDIEVKAIEALAEMGASEAVPDIVEAIGQEYGQDLSAVAFKALAKLGEPGIGALAGFLDDDDERLRRRAAAILAGAGGEAAKKAITRALRDTSYTVRLAAAKALAAKDPMDARLAPLFDDASDEVRAEAVRLSGRHHAERIAALLGDPSAAVQHAVLGSLAGYPALVPADAALEYIRSRLRHGAPKVARAAAEALGRVAPSVALDELSGLLGDVSVPPEVRLGAVGGLASLGGEEAAATLAGVLGDDHRQLRLEASAALATMAAKAEHWPNRAGEALLAALAGHLVPAPEARSGNGQEAGGDSGEPVADGSAANGSADSGEAPAPSVAIPTSTLEAILGDDSPPPDSTGTETGNASEDAELTEADMECLAMAKRRPHKKVVPVTPEIAPHQDVRRLAARVLGDVARHEVAAALAPALDDDDAEVRTAAADSLARIAIKMAGLPPEAVDALLRALKRTDRDMRLLAVRALGAARKDLGAAGEEKIGDRLAGCLADEDSFVRAEALGALSRLGGAGPKAAAALLDPDAGVRLAAARAVAKEGSAKATVPLVEFAFAFGGYHRREAGQLLRHVDGPAASARFLDVLDDAERLRDWQVAIEALDELNRCDAIATARPVTGLELGNE
jgi:HEAT repeat protein